MALESKHFDIMTAIRSAIVSDSNITASIAADRWIIQKRPWYRSQRWQPGARICALQRSYPAHENAIVKIIMQTLVSMCWPSDGSLVAGLEDELAVMERIEEMFAWKGHNNAPSTLRAMNALPIWFEQCTVEPGGQFIESMLRDGYDGLAVVVTVEVVVGKTIES